VLIALMTVAGSVVMGRAMPTRPIPDYVARRAVTGQTTRGGTAQLAKVGQAAPEFTASDSVGERHHLGDYRGKFVVLEWHSSACPLAQEQYESGAMQRLQEEWVAKGVIWLTVISAAPGKRGYVTPAQENDYMAKMNAAPAAALLDPSGQLGRLYDVKTTPEMFVINPGGTLIYAGAMYNRTWLTQGAKHGSKQSSKQGPDAANAQGAENYVAEALTEAMAGRVVKTPVTQPYGCLVKYGE
jgi:hypothetical protein